MRNAAQRYPRYDDEAPQGRAAAALEIVRHRPFDTLAGVLAAACVTMILVNALALQEARKQPAPPAAATTHASSNGATPAAQPAPQRSDLVAQIQGALTDRGYYDGPSDGLMGQKTASAIKQFEQDQRMPATGEASERTLAALLVAPSRKAPAQTPVPAPKPTAAAPAKPAVPATTGSTDISAPTLMAMQRALAKLGYGPVTIDGKMGSETQNAIRSFERDRNMPVTGEPSQKLLQALQTMSGTLLR